MTNGPQRGRVALGKNFTLLNRYMVGRMCLAVIATGRKAFFACFSLHLNSPRFLRNSRTSWYPQCFSGNKSVLKKSRRLVNTICHKHEPQIQVPQTQSAFHPHAQRTSFRRRDAHQQSRSYPYPCYPEGLQTGFQGLRATGVQGVTVRPPARSRILRLRSAKWSIPPCTQWLLTSCAR